MKNCILMFLISLLFSCTINPDKEDIEQFDNNIYGEWEFSNGEKKEYLKYTLQGLFYRCDEINICDQPIMFSIDGNEIIYQSENKSNDEFIIDNRSGERKLSLRPKGSNNYQQYSLYKKSNTGGNTGNGGNSGGSRCGYYNGKKVYKGPKGECYYYNSKGNKTYVDRSYCC